MKTVSILLLSAILLAACGNPVVDLKGPCVGDKGSPCDRRAVNQDFS